MKELSECRVLIVDDTPANVDILVQALKAEYKLSVALDGESALQSVAARAPDLVLLDIMMPGMDGYEVCRRLKRDPATREIPVVFLTALHEIESKTEGFEAGAADYVTKPFEVREVKARVRALLRAKAYQDAVRAVLEGELRVAREIQMGLVPQDFAGLGSRGGLDVFARLEPARAVGGDLYDAFPLDGRRFCLVIGDVSGKGIPAALFMVMALTLIRGIARLTARPDEVLARVNDALATDNPSSMFVTLLVGVLDVDTGVLTWASGGHLPPVVLRAGAAPHRAFEATGTVVGAIPGLTFTSTETRLEPGDMVLACTDGVTEATAPDETMFGEARLLELLAGGTWTRGRDAVDAVLDAVRAFAAGTEQADDIAVLAARWPGPARAAAAAHDALALDLRASAEDVARASTAVREFCRARGVDAEAAHDLVLALDEILTNVVRHGYLDDPSGAISVRARHGADAVEIEVRDRAPAFNPLEAGSPPLDAPFEQRGVGGLGIHLARSVTDDMSYAREEGENRLRFARRIRRAG